MKYFFILLSVYLIAPPTSSAHETEKIDGLWRTACMVDIGSFLSQIHLKNGTFKIKEWDYPVGDLTCAFPRSVSVIEGLVDLPAPNHIDYLRVKHIITPLTRDVADHYNKIWPAGLCGFKDWKARVSKNVPLDCHGHTVTYSIYKIENRLLHLGAGYGDDDGSTPEKRHGDWGHAYFRIAQQP